MVVAEAVEEEDGAEAEAAVPGEVDLVALAAAAFGGGGAEGAGNNLCVIELCLSEL